MYPWGTCTPVREPLLETKNDSDKWTMSNIILTQIPAQATFKLYIIITST